MVESRIPSDDISGDDIIPCGECGESKKRSRYHTEGDCKRWLKKKLDGVRAELAILRAQQDSARFDDLGNPPPVTVAELVEALADAFDVDEDRVGPERRARIVALIARARGAK